MNEGDRIKHKKDGLGEVLKVYTKRQTARCRMDSEKVMTYSLSRLEPAPAFAGRSTVDPDQPQRARRKHRGGTIQVDYDLLERARRYLEGENPDADRVVPYIYGYRVYCEVWRGGHAQVVFYDEL